MSHARALEAPRPLKSTLKQQALPIFQQNFEVNSIEDLIQITETVAQSLNSGDVSFDMFNKMFQNLIMHGLQLEIYSKEILDRCFNVFRNASQDDRLKIAIRLNLLNLIELRANSWVGSKCADYYKSKAQSESDIELTMLSSSPTISTMNSIMLSGQTLQPGEVVKNSGKFQKPTKIPGKNYSKDEIIIRNSDSGKVMGIKGRRVHIIEEMSNCVISFQRVNPGAKERLVQITGPNEENINYAKMLIEDTIKRNASPIRETSQEGSVSSLASSDDQQMSANRQQRSTITQIAHNPSIMTQLPMTTANKLTRSSSHHNANYLVHSASANDANLGEYKYTVNIGNHTLKITGDSLELVRVAKLVLDDFFTNDEFLKSNEAISLVSDVGVNVVPIAHQIPTQPSPFIDSGVHLDLLTTAGQNVTLNQTISHDADDDVFIHSDGAMNANDVNILTSSSSMESSNSSNTVITEHQSNVANSATNGLARSRRSHFSRKESTPEIVSKPKSDSEFRITYSLQSLWWFSKNSPLCKNSPPNMEKIREKCPSIVRDKTNDSNTIKYCDDQFMELRDKMDRKNFDAKVDDVIEIDDED